MFERAKDKLQRGDRTPGSSPPPALSALIDQVEGAVPFGLLSLRRGRRSYDNDRDWGDPFDFDNDEQDEDE